MNITVNIDPEEAERIKNLLNKPPRFEYPPNVNETRYILGDGTPDGPAESDFNGIQLPPIFD